MSLIIGDKVIVGPGNSPYVGNNGHWFVGTEDTGVPAETKIFYKSLEEFNTCYDEGIYHVYDADKQELHTWHINNTGKKSPITSSTVLVPRCGENGNWFLGEIDLDLAEFTVMTPFPHTKGYDDLLRQGRIFDFDWDHYNAGQVVFQPKHMSPERLQELYDYAWKSFYAEESQEQKMFRLFCNVAMREMEDGTYRPRDRKLANKSFGKDVIRNINK